MEVPVVDGPLGVEKYFILPALPTMPRVARGALLLPAETRPTHFQ